MTRTEAIEKIKAHLRANGGTDTECELAFVGNSPMRGAFLMLEALGLIKFDQPRLSVGSVIARAIDLSSPGSRVAAVLHDLEAAGYKIVPVVTESNP